MASQCGGWCLAEGSPQHIQTDPQELLDLAADFELAEALPR
jgi:hypothetical protein